LVESDYLVEREDDFFEGISENSSGTGVSGVASEESDRPDHSIFIAVFLKSKGNEEVVNAL
jgi:hypothetical protein